MTELTSARLAELRAVAEAATPGPWVFDPPGMWGDEDDIPQSAVRQIDSGSITWDDHGGEVFKPEDAAHIATFDPPTVLALIAALEAKTAEVERLDREVWRMRALRTDASADRTLEMVERERDEALAEASKIEGRAVEWSKRADRAEAAIERVRAAHGGGVRERRAQDREEQTSD